MSRLEASRRRSGAHFSRVTTHRRVRPVWRELRRLFARIYQPSRAHVNRIRTCIATHAFGRVSTHHSQTRARTRETRIPARVNPIARFHPVARGAGASLARARRDRRRHGCRSRASGRGGVRQGDEETHGASTAARGASRGAATATGSGCDAGVRNARLTRENARARPRAGVERGFWELVRWE